MKKYLKTYNSFARKEKLLTQLIVLILTSQIVLGFIYGVGTFADVLRGYYSLIQWQNGGNFNELSYANGEFTVFNAWWTPGQFCLPYLIQSISGIGLHAAQCILILISLVIAVLSYYKLFRYLGFSVKISLVSLIVIVSNQLFFWQSMLYYGGSLFELALLPAFLLFLLKLKNSEATTKNLFILILFSLALFFLKATFLLHAGIGIIALLVFSRIKDYQRILKFILSGVFIYALCYFCFLQFGESPSSAIDIGSYDNIPNSTILDLTNAFSSIPGIFTNVTPLLQKTLLLHPQYQVAAYFLFGLFTLIALHIAKYIWNTFNLEARFLLVYGAVFFLFMSILYLQNNAVSYDLRHFAPIVFCFFPFCISYVKILIRSRTVINAFLVLLISGNIGLFVVKRIQFSQRMERTGELYFTKEETNIYKALAKIPKINNDQLIIIEDYWLPAFWLPNKNILPVYKENDQIYLLSGMELDHAEQLNFNRIMTENENFILITPNINSEFINVFNGFKTDILSNSDNLLILSFTK